MDVRFAFIDTDGLHGKESFNSEQRSKYSGRKVETKYNNCYELNYWRYKSTLRERNKITYCQVKLLLIPSLRRSRNERWRLGPGPVIILISLLGDDDDDEFKNFVGLKCCWDSFKEWDGDDVLKLKFVLLNGERCWCCFGDGSSREVAIWFNFDDHSKTSSH